MRRDHQHLLSLLAPAERRGLLRREAAFGLPEGVYTVGYLATLAVARIGERRRRNSGALGSNDNADRVQSANEQDPVRCHPDGVQSPPLCLRRTRRISQ